MSVLAAAADDAAAAGAWAPVSPEHPRPDPEHAARGVGLQGSLGALPLLFKKDVRATLPRQWAPPGRDVRADLASGALELVETSGSTGDRLRILWDEGWWMRQEARAMRTNELVAAALDGAHGPYRESILTTPTCSLDACHIGDLPYEE